MKKITSTTKAIAMRAINGLKCPQFLSFGLMLILGAGNALAADDDAGAAVIGDVANSISSYQDPVQKLLYAIAAIIAIIGAFNIFNKMNNGDQDVKKTIMLTLGGCIALVALATALPSFFDI